MNINPIIEKAFENFVVDGIKIPISYMKYKGDAKSYLTYYTYMTRPEGFADDVPVLVGTYATIDIFSKGNFKKILKEVKKILKENKFTWIDDEAEDYEENTGLFHVPVNFYMESEGE